MRLFLAVVPPFPVRHEIAAAVEEMRGRVRGRFVPPPNLHLTLLFLGEVEPAGEETVRAAARSVAANRAPFTVEWGGGGVFPARSRARVAWLGVREGGDALVALADSLRRDLGRADEKPFRPHLTLARFHRPPRSGDLDALLDGLGPLSWRHRVEAFHLLQSRLDPDGAVYAERAAFDLTGPR